MTDQEIIKAAATNPAVIQARTYPNGQGGLVVPTPNELQAVAAVELQAELGHIFAQRSIRNALRYRQYALTLSGGTEITQGTHWTLPDYISEITDVTIGTGREPLTLYTNRKDFNRWWYGYVGEQDSTQSARARGGAK